MALSGPELAAAYVSVSLNTGGLGDSIKKELGAAGNAGGKVAGEKGGVSLLDRLGGVLKKGVLAIGATAGGLLATSLVKGWGRLTSIENATAKLSGLGNSAETVASIMNNALASVKGTAFGLDEAATTAAGVVAAGIKPGKELQGVLQTVADTATIAGKSMADTGAIFGSVAARGKLQGDDLMQLQSAGVPVLAMLAKHYGITAAAASEMVTKGKVDFENFNAALQENLGGAALKSGETTQGALKNMWAAFGRFGAQLAGPAFGGAKTFFVAVTGWVDGLTAKVGPALERVSKLAMGVSEVFTKGDFNPANWPGFDEDSPVVGFFFTLRDAATAASSVVSKANQRMLDSLAANSWADAFRSIRLGLQGVTDEDELDGLSYTLWSIGAKARDGFQTAAAAAKTGWASVVASARESSPKTRALLASAFQLPASAADSWKSLASAGLGAAMDTLRPILKDVTEMFSGLVTAAAPGFAQLGKAIAPILNLLPQLLSLLSPVHVIFKAIEPLLPQIGTLIGTLAGSIASFVGGAIQSLTPLLQAIVGVIDRLMPIISTLIASLLPPLNSLFQALAPLLDAVLAAILPIVDVIASALIPIIEALMPVVETVFGTIGSIIGAVMKVFGGLIDFLTGIFTGDWSKAWDGIKSIFKGVWDAAVAIVQGAWSILKGIWDTIASVFRSVVLDPLKAAVGWLKSNIIDPIVNAFTAAWDGVKKVWTVVAGWFDSIVWQPLKKAWDWINRNFITPLVDGFTGAVNLIKSAWQGIIDFFKSIVNGIITGINTLIHAINGITGALSSVWTWTGLPGIPHIPDIPRLAKGTDFWPGGAAIIGEAGPELVNLPRGSQVTPASETAALRSGMQGGPKTMTVEVNLDSRRIGRATAPVIASELRVSTGALR